MGIIPLILKLFGLGGKASAAKALTATAGKEVVKDKAVETVVQEKAAEGAMQKLSPIGGVFSKTPNPPLKMVDLATKAEPKERTFDKLLQGETFGSKMFLNTISNFGKSGGFTRSDVGQPDRDFSQIMANSLVSSLGTSAMQQREQNYTYRQNLLNMASDVNVAEDIYKEWSPKTLERINGFKSSMVNMMYSNRKKGLSGLTSDDMMKAQMDYMQVKKDVDRFNTGLKTLNEATQTVGKDANNTWDVGFYNDGIKYFRETGKPPAEGFLKAAPKAPQAFFPQVRITPISQWSKAAPENGFMRSGSLTDEQKQLEAIAQLNSNAGVRRWAEENGYDPNNTKDQIRFGLDHYQYIEQPQKDEYAEALYQDKMERKQERAEDRAMSNAKDMPYNVTGNSVVFKKNTTENVPVSELRTITGGSYEGDADELLPVVFENIDSKGNLTVAAKEGRGSDAKTRRYVVPPAKAKGLVESYYPGVWSNVEKMYKAPNTPTGVYKSDMEDKINLFMEKNGITSRDVAVKKLRELKIL